MVLIIIIILFYGSISLVKIFECNPRAKVFNRVIKWTCVDIFMLLNTSGCFNTITEFLILFLPVRAVWDLNMSRPEKLIVLLVFTFGLWCVQVLMSKVSNPNELAIERSDI